MAANSGIEWTTHTANPWWGCIKVSNGEKGACTNCYASDLSNRFGHDFERRRKPIKAFWKDLPRWNQQAQETGNRPRVFIMSMGDIWERLPETHEDYAFLEDARQRALTLIEACTALEVLLLTKRVSNISKLAPAHWLHGHWPAHVRQGISVVTQAESDRDIPRLLALPCRNFLSLEPLRGNVNIGRWLSRFDYCPEDSEPNGCDGCTGTGRGDCNAVMMRGIDWVITGGESGDNARPSHPDWFRSLRDQCTAAGVPFFFKQWGEYGPVEPDHRPCVIRIGDDDIIGMARIGKKKAGALLDGMAWKQFPVQEAG